MLSVGQGLDLSLAPWSRQAPSPHLDGEGSGDQGPREQKKTKLLGGEVVQGVEGEAVGRLGGHVAWQSQVWQGTKCNTAAGEALEVVRGLVVRNLATALREPELYPGQDLAAQLAALLAGHELEEHRANLRNADSRKRQQLAQHQSQKQKYLFW